MAAAPDDAANATPPPATPATPEPAPLPLPRLNDCQYAAYLSYAQADDVAWFGWVDGFGKELERSLAARLRGAHLPPLLRDSSSGPVAGPVADELRLRLASSFALILVVHDNYVQSEWCAYELEMFKALFGEAGLRERLYIVAMSQPAALRLTASAGWARLMPQQQLAWAPYYEDDDPGRPLMIYDGSQKGEVVSPHFRDRLLHIREDLARKMQADLTASPPTPAVRMWVEIDQADLPRWQPLAQSLQQAWAEVVQAELGRNEPVPVLQLEPARDGRIDAADAVLLTWSGTPMTSLAMRIEDIERRLPATDPAPAAVACLTPWRRPDGDPMPLAWPMIHFDAGAPERADMPDEDRARLAMLLRKVLQRWQRPHAA